MALADRRDFRLRNLPLERLVAFLDFRDGLPGIVVRRDRLGRNASALLVVKPADEPDLLQQLLRRLGGKIEDGVFLADLPGDRGEEGIYGCENSTR